MDISRNDQKQFARELLAISERDVSPEIIDSLRKLSSLLVSWVGEENSVAVNLSEYIGKLCEIANGGEDTGWKDEFKSILEKDINI